MVVEDVTSDWRLGKHVKAAGSIGGRPHALHILVRVVVSAGLEL